MSAHDDCVLWTLVGVSGRRVVCYAVAGDEGLAVTVEYDDNIVLAEMVADMDTAIRRADAVRHTLLATGLKDVSGV